jgi:MFS transporter, YNFM family, putative membrane transport protein
LSTKDQTASTGRAIFFLACAAFASAATTRIPDPLLPQIAGEFGITIGAASIIVTAYSLAYGLLQIAFGPLGDRYGKYHLVLLACVLSAVTSILCSFSGSLNILTLARLAAGAAAAMIIPLAIAWIGDVVPYEQRQRVLARFMSGQISGLILGQTAGGLLGQYFGWRSAFLIVAAFYVVAGFGLLFEARRNPLANAKPVATTASLSQSYIAMLRIARRKWPLTCLIGVFIEGCAMFGALAYIGADLHQRFNIGFDILGLMLAAYGLGGLAYTFVSRQLIEFMGETGLLRGGGLVQAAGFIGIAYAPNAIVASVSIMLVGFGFYMMHNTFQTHATQMAPDARGAGVALFASCLFVGQSLGVATAAPIMDHYGGKPIFWTAAIILIALGFWFAQEIVKRRAATISL